MFLTLSNNSLTGYKGNIYSGKSSLFQSEIRLKSYQFMFCGVEYGYSP